MQSSSTARALAASLSLSLVFAIGVSACATEEAAVAKPAGTKKRGAECKASECVTGLECAPSCTSLTPLSCSTVSKCVDACDSATTCGSSCCAMFPGNARGACVDKTTADGAGGARTCK